MVIGYLIVVVILKVIRVRKGWIGIFRLMFFVFNFIFIGFLVNMVLFGEKSIFSVLLYYIVNIIFFWIFGVYEISRDGEFKNVNIFFLDILKRIILLLFIGFVLGVIFVVFNIYLLKFILDICKYFGNLIIFLVMLFIGIIIYFVDLK